MRAPNVYAPLKETPLLRYRTPHTFNASGSIIRPCVLQQAQQAREVGGQGSLSSRRHTGPTRPAADGEDVTSARRSRAGSNGCREC